MDNHTCCEIPDGYRLDDGVFGTELRAGASSGLRSVCSWRPMGALETVDESITGVRKMRPGSGRRV